MRVSWRECGFPQQCIPHMHWTNQRCMCTGEGLCHHLTLQPSLTGDPTSKWGWALEATHKSEVPPRFVVNPLWKLLRDHHRHNAVSDFTCITFLVTIKWKTKWPFPLETEPKWNKYKRSGSRLDMWAGFCPHQSWVWNGIQHLGLTYILFGRDHGCALKMTSWCDETTIQITYSNHQIMSCCLKELSLGVPEPGMHPDSMPWIQAPCQNSQLKKEGWGDEKGTEKSCWIRVMEIAGMRSYTVGWGWNKCHILQSLEQNVNWWYAFTIQIVWVLKHMGIYFTSNSRIFVFQFLPENTNPELPAIEVS